MRTLEKLIHGLLMLAFVVALAMIARPAFAQVGCESPGDGAPMQQKAGVKKLGDSFAVSWTAPTELADADCTPIADDPAFAITSYEVYIEIDQPAQSGAAFPPVATLPATQTEFAGTLDFESLRPGGEVYYAVAACNEFGCSDLSAQPWHKLGGPPGKPQGVGAQ